MTDLTEVKMTTMPKCNWCDAEAEYDFKTVYGPWAYGCNEHFNLHNKYDSLGMGKGQHLVKDNSND